MPTYRRQLVTHGRPVAVATSGGGGTSPPVTVGIDFRATPGYVTDPAGYTVNTGTGWETPPDGALDRSRSVDPRLAGVVWVRNSTKHVASLKLDVPPGDYELRLALGDATNVERQNCVLLDGETPIATVADDYATFAGHFLDAMGIERSAADWPTANRPRALTLRNGSLRIHLGNAASGLASSTIASLSLVSSP